MSETIHTYPGPIGRDQMFDADVDFGDVVVWPSSQAAFKREAPETAKFIAELFDRQGQPWRYVRDARVNRLPQEEYPSADVEVLVHPVLEEGYDRITDYQVFVRTTIEWLAPEEIVATYGIPEATTADLVEWYRSAAPETVDGEPGVTCRKNFTVLSAGDFHDKVTAEVKRCQAEAARAWAPIFDKIRSMRASTEKEIRAIKRRVMR